MTGNLAATEMIVGFISATFVLPVIQQPTWTSKRRATVTFVYSIIVGLITAALTGDFTGLHDWHTGSAAVLTLLVSAIGVYKGFAEPTKIAPRIEDATSKKPS